MKFSKWLFDPCESFDFLAVLVIGLGAVVIRDHHMAVLAFDDDADPGAFVIVHFSSSPAFSGSPRTSTISGAR